MRRSWFRTRDQRRIDPLTITDSHSRVLIDVRITAPTIAGAPPILVAALRAHGLPRAIRCDHGARFGSTGAGGLTRLSARRSRGWLKLGLEPRFIRPAAPQKNGRHERRHRTLKAQTSRPPAATADEQQARFDAFRRHDNLERPRAKRSASGRQPQAYARSPRAMPERVADPWYDAVHQARRVHSAGEIKWQGGQVFVSAALVGELLGIAELETGDHVVRFCDRDLGLIDRHARFRRFAPPRPGLRQAAEPAHHTQLSTISPVQTVDHQTG